MSANTPPTYYFSGIYYNPTFYTSSNPKGYATLSGTNPFTGTNTFNTNLPTSTLTPSAGTQLITKTYGDTTYQATGSYATLAGANAFTGTNTFNTNLPTSTVTPTTATQLITKTYGDTTYQATGSYATLAGTNAFTGTNTFNTNLPTSTVTPTTATELITKTYGDTTYQAAGSYATLAGTNAFTGTNTFNTNLPTSTVTPTTAAQLITKTYGDTTYQAAGSYVTLAGTNAFTGTNTFNTNLPTSTQTPTTAAQLTTKTYVDSNFLKVTYTGSNATFGNILTVGGFNINNDTKLKFTLNPTAAILGDDGLNTYFGSNTMLSIGSNYNVAFGDNIMQSLTTGNNNAAVGYNSGKAITSGYNNVLHGTGAGIAITTGHDNTAIGFNSLLSTVGNFNNVAVGTYALQNNTGGDNVAIGNNALQIASGINNSTAVGSQAGKNASGGIAALGYLCLTAASSNQTGVGCQSLQNNTGTSNSSLGYQALQNNVTGNNNVAVGHQALQSTSNNNSNNTAIGYQAFISGNFTQSTAVGYNAQPTASNQVILGTSAETVVCPNNLTVTGTVNSATINTAGTGTFVDITNTQTISGNKTFTGTNNFTGTLLSTTPNINISSATSPTITTSNTNNNVLNGTAINQASISATNSYDLAVYTIVVPAYSSVDITINTPIGFSLTGLTMSTFSNINLQVSHASAPTFTLYRTTATPTIGIIATKPAIVVPPSGQITQINFANTISSITAGNAYQFVGMCTGTFTITNSNAAASTYTTNLSGAIITQKTAGSAVSFTARGNIYTNLTSAITTSQVISTTPAGLSGFISSAYPSYSALNNSQAQSQSQLTSGSITANNIYSNFYNGLSIISFYLNYAIGNFLFGNQPSGYYNLGIGYQVLQALTTGGTNTAVGMVGVLNSLTTGNSNTALGSGAGQNITTGSSNTAIGYNAYNTGNFSNSTAIGYNSQPTANNQVVLGTSAETVVCPNNLTVAGNTTHGTNGTAYKSIVSFIVASGSSASNNLAVATTLSYGYTNAAKLIVNITMSEGAGGGSDAYLATITSITTTQLNFRVYRCDANTGWGNVTQAHVTIHELV